MEGGDNKAEFLKGLKEIEQMFSHGDCAHISQQEIAGLTAAENSVRWRDYQDHQKVKINLPEETTTYCEKTNRALKKSGFLPKTAGAVDFARTTKLHRNVAVSAAGRTRAVFDSKECPMKTKALASKIKGKKEQEKKPTLEEPVKRAVTAGNIIKRSTAAPGRRTTKNFTRPDDCLLETKKKPTAKKPGGDTTKYWNKKEGLSKESDGDFIRAKRLQDNTTTASSKSKGCLMTPKRINAKEEPETMNYFEYNKHWNCDTSDSVFGISSFPSFNRFREKGGTFARIKSSTKLKESSLPLEASKRASETGMIESWDKERDLPEESEGDVKNSETGTIQSSDKNAITGHTEEKFLDPGFKVQENIMNTEAAESYEEPQPIENTLESGEFTCAGTSQKSSDDDEERLLTTKGFIRLRNAPKPMGKTSKTKITMRCDKGEVSERPSVDKSCAVIHVKCAGQQREKVTTERLKDSFASTRNSTPETARDSESKERTTEFIKMCLGLGDFEQGNITKKANEDKASRKTFQVISKRGIEKSCNRNEGRKRSSSEPIKEAIGVPLRASRPLGNVTTRLKIAQKKTSSAVGSGISRKEKIAEGNAGSIDGFSEKDGGLYEEPEPTAKTLAASDSARAKGSQLNTTTEPTASKESTESERCPALALNATKKLDTHRDYDEKHISQANAAPELRIRSSTTSSNKSKEQNGTRLRSTESCTGKPSLHLVQKTDAFKCAGQLQRSTNERNKISGSFEKPPWVNGYVKCLNQSCEETKRSEHVKSAFGRPDYSRRSQGISNIGRVKKSPQSKERLEALKTEIKAKKPESRNSGFGKVLGAAKDNESTCHARVCRHGVTKPVKGAALVKEFLAALYARNKRKYGKKQGATEEVRNRDKIQRKGPEKVEKRLSGSSDQKPEISLVKSPKMPEKILKNLKCKSLKYIESTKESQNRMQGLAKRTVKVLDSSVPVRLVPYTDDPQSMEDPLMTENNWMYGRNHDDESRDFQRGEQEKQVPFNVASRVPHFQKQQQTVMLNDIPPKDVQLKVVKILKQREKVKAAEKVASDSSFEWFFQRKEKKLHKPSRFAQSKSHAARRPKAVKNVVLSKWCGCLNKTSKILEKRNSQKKDFLRGSRRVKPLYKRDETERQDTAITHTLSRESAAQGRKQLIGFEDRKCDAIANGNDKDGERPRRLFTRVKKAYKPYGYNACFGTGRRRHKPTRRDPGKVEDALERLRLKSSLEMKERETDDENMTEKELKEGLEEIANVLTCVRVKNCRQSARLITTNECIGKGPRELKAYYELYVKLFKRHKTDGIYKDDKNKLSSGKQHSRKIVTSRKRMTSRKFAKINPQHARAIGYGKCTADHGKSESCKCGTFGPWFLDNSPLDLRTSTSESGGRKQEESTILKDSASSSKDVLRVSEIGPGENQQMCFKDCHPWPTTATGPFGGLSAFATRPIEEPFRESRGETFVESPSVSQGQSKKVYKQSNKRGSCTASLCRAPGRNFRSPYLTGTPLLQTKTPTKEEQEKSSRCLTKGQRSQPTGYRPPPTPEWLRGWSFRPKRLRRRLPPIDLPPAFALPPIYANPPGLSKAPQARQAQRLREHYRYIPDLPCSPWLWLQRRPYYLSLSMAEKTLDKLKKKRRRYAPPPRCSRINSKRPLRFKCTISQTVCDVLKSRGWVQTEESNPECWNLFWCDFTQLKEFFDKTNLKGNQKVPHFRNHYELSRKNLLIKNLKKYRRILERCYSKEEAKHFDFYPTTFELPNEYRMFLEAYKRDPGSIWIVKPSGGSQGKGIFIFKRLKEFHDWTKSLKNETDINLIGASIYYYQNETYVVQRYLDRPYLLAGRKFDLRLYVLVPSFQPLYVWVYREGFARFTGKKYNRDELNDIYRHLTNTAIQKKCQGERSTKGFKKSLTSIRHILSTLHGPRRIDILMHNINNIIINSLLSVQNIIIQVKSSFALYGYDIIIDETLKPWLLEINAAPSLCCTNEADRILKYSMLHDCFNIINLDKKIKLTGLEKHIGGFDLQWYNGPVYPDDYNGFCKNEGLCHLYEMNSSALLGLPNNRLDQLKMFKSAPSKRVPFKRYCARPRVKKVKRKLKQIKDDWKLEDLH